MFENYKVAVKVSLVDGVSTPMALMAKHFVKTNEEAKALQARLTGIKNMFMGGTLLVGAGAAIAAPLLYAIDKAAELQKQMLGIQVATRGTTGEMDKMRGVIEKVASQTIFSNVDVARMGKLVATGTGLGASEVSGLLPQYAQFADVQMLMKGTSYEQSVSDAIRLAHTAQKYDPQSLSKYLDTLTKASFIVPGGLGEVGHALKYSQGIAKTALGIDDENMILLVSLLNRLGFAGSRGGTNLIAAMTRTIPGIFGSGLLTGKSGEALKAMGMVDAKGQSNVFKDGKFDAFTWMGRLSEYVAHEFARNPEQMARQHIMTNFQHAFGSQGSRVASLLSDPKALEQLMLIGQAFQGYGGVESVQRKFADEAVSQQWMNAKTNFESAMTEIGITLLPTATKALKRLNSYLGELIQWITKNPEKVKEYATNMGLLAAALVGLGALTTVVSGINAFSVAIQGLTGVLMASGAWGAARGGAVGTAVAGGSAVLGVGAAALGGWYLGKGINWAIERFTGDSLGGHIYDWTHPDQGSLSSHPTVRSSGSKANVTVINKIDKNGLTTLVTQGQSKAMGLPLTGPRTFDPSMSPLSVAVGQ